MQGENLHMVANENLAAARLDKANVEILKGE